MTEGKKATGQELHKKFAVELFNQVWDLLEKEDRTVEEEDKMIHAAHASRFHWGEIGTPLEFERGEWQISRVYAVLNHPHGALYHGQRCLEICQANEIGDFDIAFAYEALARAHAVAGNPEKAQKYLALAQQAAGQIADEGNRDYFLGELKDIIALLQ